MFLNPYITQFKEVSKSFGMSLITFEETRLKILTYSNRNLRNSSKNYGKSTEIQPGLLVFTKPVRSLVYNFMFAYVIKQKQLPLNKTSADNSKSKTKRSTT